MRGTDLVWAEDSGSDQFLIQTVLDEIDPPLRVSFAEDGGEALRLARRLRPRLLVLDINMPRLGGIEALRMLRADPDLAGLQAVLFSSGALPRHVEEAKALGALACVQKPLEFMAFRSAVHAIVAHAVPVPARTG